VRTPDIAVVMPAFNEADGIEEFLVDLQKSFLDQGIGAVFCIVDDRSTDGTAEVAAAVAGHLGIDLVIDRNVANLGHGPTSLAAWEAGLATGAPWIVHVDGDGQYEGADVVRVATVAGGDGALGIRTTRADPWFRKMLSRLLRVYVRTLSGVKPRDANTPLRAYRREALQELLSVLPRRPMVPSVYLSAAGHTKGLELVEVPVHSRPRRGQDSTGTMWGGGRLRALLPSRRLVGFVWGAFVESISVLRSLRR